MCSQPRQHAGEHLEAEVLLVAQTVRSALEDAYFVATVSVAAIGFVAPAIMGMMITVFHAGFPGLGAFAGMNLLAATLYPTELRSAGVGGAIAASKAGSIAGPMAAGAGLSANLPLTGVFMISASGGLIACACIVLLSRARARAGTEE